MAGRQVRGMAGRSIHDFERKVRLLHAKVSRAEISRENRELLLGFERMCAAEGLSLARR